MISGTLCRLQAGQPRVGESLILLFQLVTISLSENQDFFVANVVFLMYLICFVVVASFFVSFFMLMFFLSSCVYIQGAFVPSFFLIVLSVLYHGVFSLYTDFNCPQRTSTLQLYF